MHILIVSHPCLTISCERRRERKLHWTLNLMRCLLSCQLVPDLGIGTTTRVALDFECGTGSLSRVLGQRGVATLCLASYDSLEDGIQLVMERGFPGLLTHSLSSRIRFPYPSQAFDLLHCAACNISWASNGWFYSLYFLLSNIRIILRRSELDMVVECLIVSLC